MMIKGKIYGYKARFRVAESTEKQKIQQYCWIFEFQMYEEDQLPNQLDQGIRLRIKTNPTAYIM